MEGELDEGEIVGGELVVSGRDAPALLDLVEEPLRTSHAAFPGWTTGAFSTAFFGSICGH